MSGHVYTDTKEVHTNI